MLTESFWGWLKHALFLTGLAVGTFFGLQALEISTGSLALWFGIGASYLVLSAIAYLPWNIHFEADDSLEFYRENKKRGISVDADNLAYAEKTFIRSRRIAVTAHVVTALVFVGIGYGTSIGWVGYFAAGATVALTFLRPLLRAAAHTTARLRANRGTDATHPREDVKALSERITAFEGYDKKAEEVAKESKTAAEVHQKTLKELAELKQAFEDYKKTDGQSAKELEGRLTDKINSVSDASKTMGAVDTITSQGGSVTFNPEEGKKGKGKGKNS